MEGWDEIASKAVQAAFMRHVCTGMSQPHEWGDNTKLCMKLCLQMYAQGYAAGMTRAAEICEQRAGAFQEIADACADAIRTGVKDQS